MIVNKSLPILLMIMLAGCAAPSPAPGDHFYRLATADPVECGTPFSEGIIRLDPFRSAGLLRERNIVYIDSPDSIEFNNYHYHLWHETPAYLVRNHLLDYLRQCDAAAMVTAAPDVPAQFTVYGDITELMQIRDEGPGYVRISVELQLRHKDVTDPLLINAYREEEPIATDDMPAVVDAFSRGLTRIYQRFLAEAGQVRVN